jgi:hypothetical protein
MIDLQEVLLWNDPPKHRKRKPSPAVPSDSSDRFGARPARGSELRIKSG